MTTGYAELEGGRCLLVLDGHATGSPSVCAAISGLVYALAGYLTNAEREVRAEVYAAELEPGRVRIHASGDDRCVGACEAVLLGLCQLVESEPDYLRMEIFEE